MSKPAEKLLVSQQQALWDYLDALLREIPEDYPEAPAAAADQEIQDWDPTALAADAGPKPGQAPLEAPEAPLLEPPREAPPQPVEEEAEATPTAPPVGEGESPADGPPAWSRPQFQALLFKVDGLTLAVPLVKLHSVIPWPEDGVTAMPNQPRWCFGLLRYREQNVRIVDTGTLVIPEDKRASMEPEQPKHILVVGDGRWGLACSAIGDVIKLAPTEVKWRGGQGRRPWLAGTVLGHLCALLDTEAFAEMLKGRGR